MTDATPSPHPLAPGPLALDPFDPAQTHHMWNLIPRFQQEAPVARIGNGFVLVSRYEDVVQVLRGNGGMLGQVVAVVTALSEPGAARMPLLRLH